jgi:hypothetical protein
MCITSKDFPEQVGSSWLLTESGGMRWRIILCRRLGTGKADNAARQCFASTRRIFHNIFTSFGVVQESSCQQLFGAVAA